MFTYRFQYRVLSPGYQSSPILFRLEHRPGLAVDFILIFYSIAVKFDLVDTPSVVPIGFTLVRGGTADPGVMQGSGAGVVSGDAVGAMMVGLAVAACTRLTRRVLP